MKAFSCDLCGKYFLTVPIGSIERTITDPVLSLPHKKLRIWIQVKAYENSESPELCFECFKKEVNAALTMDMKGESL